MLKDLYCDSNQLVKLNLSNCQRLEWADCSNNKLEELRIDHLTQLRVLYCHDNQLSSLNTSLCESLEELSCYNNPLNAR